MASILKHFADPHPLLKRQYSGSATYVICDICGSKLAGHTGYQCRACNFDIHEACAHYFKETVSFFAHPWHTLTLTRMPTSCVGWVCDLCREGCAPGDFVYRCARCMFDVHPLCTLLPQTIRCPADPAHGICLVPTTAPRHGCSACDTDLDGVWHYCCGSCRLKLHIACAADVSAGGAEQGDAQTASGGSSGAQSNAVVARPRRRVAVAKFLLKASFRLAVHAATGGLASPVFDVLAAALS